jgi:transposase
VEVITSIQRRRRYSSAEKVNIIAQISEQGASVSSIARRHGIAPSQLYQWRRAMKDGAIAGVGSQDGLVARSELKKLQERTRRLEQLLGMKTEEVECLKEAVRIGREKKLISRAPLSGVADFE